MPHRPLPPDDLAHILHHARPSFDTLRHANLFITGGTGFFGHWLLESLLHANRELNLQLKATVLTRNAAAFRANSPHITSDPALTLLEGDIATFPFPSEPHTHILHAATDSTGKQSTQTPESLAASILAGTQHVLDFARHTGNWQLETGHSKSKARSSQLEAGSSERKTASRQPVRFLYTSTGAVYGRSTPLLHTPETYPLPPLPPHSYESAKLAAENLCLSTFPPQLGYTDPGSTILQRGASSALIAPEGIGYPDPGSTILQREASSALVATAEIGYPGPGSTILQRGASSALIATERIGYPDPSGSGLIGSEERGALAPVIARCFAFVGPHLPLDAHFAIGNFLGAAISGRPIHIKSDGTPRRSWLYMSDLAIWLWTLLTHGQPGRAYNVGSDDGMTIAEAAGVVSRTCHPEAQPKDLLLNPPRIQIAGIPDPAAPLNSYVPDITRARTELGLQVTIPLPEALRRTAAWHQDRELITSTPGLP